MPPKKFNPEKLMKSKPVSLGLNIGQKMSAIKRLQNEIKEMQKQNESLQKQIDEFEEASITTIKHYREQIDSKTTQMNELKNKALKLKEETNAKIQEMYDANEKAKDDVSKENEEVLKKIEATEKQMGIILEFEQNKQSIQAEIEDYELKIDQKKKSTEDQIEKDKKDNEEAEQRIHQENKQKLENEKNKYYMQLIATTDQASLNNIQKRNNLDSDLRSLEEMHQKYSSKIQDCEKKNNKLRDTIEQLHRDQLIDESAEQSKQIAALQKEIADTKVQLKEMAKKAKDEHEEQTKKRKEEAEEMELKIKEQQDLLDHKLQQIASLRELTLVVLSYRSQLEAEFITVLGEVIYEVAQRENPGVALTQSRATRKLSMTNSAASSAASSVRGRQKGKEININSILSKFTKEDRLSVLQRFMEAVQTSVENKSETDLSQRSTLSSPPTQN